MKHFIYNVSTFLLLAASHTTGFAETKPLFVPLSKPAFLEIPSPKNDGEEITTKELPYSASFKEETGEWANDWTTIDNSPVAGSTWKWSMYSNFTDYAGGVGMVSDNGKYPDDYFVSPALKLETGKTYTLDLSYVTYQTGGDLEIGLMSNNEDAGTFTKFASGKKDGNKYYPNDKFDFTVESDGSYYLAFHATNPNNSYAYIYLFDMAVAEKEKEVKPKEIPYSASFKEETGEWANDWTTIDNSPVAGSTWKWSMYSNFTDYAGGVGMVSDNGKYPDDYFVSPALKLETGKTYTLDLSYVTYQTGGDLEIGLMSNNEDAGTFTKFASGKKDGNKYYPNDKFDFTVESDGSYYLAFHATNPNNSYAYIYLFDMAVAEKEQDVISEQPEGTLIKGLYNHSEGYIKQLSTIYSHTEDGTAKDVVVGTDGNVYIKNPVQRFVTNTWMKATKGSGDTLVVKLPQKIYVDNSGDEPYNYYLQRMIPESNSDGSINYVIDPNCNTIRFIMRGDSIFKAEEDKDALLGLAYPSGNWEGHGSKTILLKKVTEKPAVPANAEASSETYAMTTTLSDGSQDTRVVNVAIEGNDIYLGNINDDQPEQWTKGRIEGNKVIFEGGIYMGLDTIKNIHTYFFPAGKKTIESESPFGTTLQDSVWFEKELVFDYDATNKTLTSKGGFLINQGKELVNFLTSYWEPQLKAWTATISAPGDPVIDYFEPYDDNMGYSYVQFFLDKTDKDGNQLDAKQLYYNIFLDDKLFTFTPGAYMVDEEMTDVPYDYQNFFDFYIDDLKHTVYFYTNDFSTVGIQAFYLDGENKLKSGMVTYDVTGVKAAKQGKTVVKSVVYYDLSGRKISKPTHGLYMKSVTYTDGSVKIIKTSVR